MLLDQDERGLGVGIVLHGKRRRATGTSQQEPTLEAEEAIGKSAALVWRFGMKGNARYDPSCNPLEGGDRGTKPELAVAAGATVMALDGSWQGICCGTMRTVECTRR